MRNLMTKSPALWISIFSLAAIGLLGLIPQGEQPMAGLSLIRLGLALVAILSLIRVLVPVLQGLNKSVGRQSGRIKLEAALGLGGKQKAAILSVDGREFLIAYGQERITLLAELGEDAVNSEEGLSDEEARKLTSRLRRVEPV